MFWKPSMVRDTIDVYGCYYNLIPASQHKEDWMDLLDKGNIIIINVNMRHIPRGVNINKSYSTWLPFWGHYMVIKGHNEVMANTFDVLDPYDPSTSEGRPYDMDIIIDAVFNYYPNLIVI
jgi:hypothetical protein